MLVSKINHKPVIENIKQKKVTKKDASSQVDSINLGSSDSKSIPEFKSLADNINKKAGALLNADNEETIKKVSNSLYCTWNLTQSNRSISDTFYDKNTKTIYTKMHTTEGAHLTAIDTEGKVKWVYTDEEVSWRNGPVMDKNGNVFIRSFCEVIAIDNSGKKKWSYHVSPHCGTNETPIAVGNDGTVYATTSGLTGEFTLFAIKEENGKPEIKWKFESHNNPNNPNPISIGKDGTIFLSVLETEKEGLFFPKTVTRSKIAALKPEDGSVKFKVEIAKRLASRTYLEQADDGTIYVSHGKSFNNPMKMDEHNKVTAFSKRGREKWSYILPNLPYTEHSIDHTTINQAPCVDRTDGSIYIASDAAYNYPEGYLVRLNKYGNEQWKITVRDDAFTTKPQIGPDGNLYVGSKKGFLYIYEKDGKLKNKIAIGETMGNNFSFGENGEVFLNTEEEVKAIQPDINKLSEENLKKVQESLNQSSDTDANSGSIEDNNDFIIIDGVKIPKKQ